jgi:hypothetical protein
MLAPQWAQSIPTEVELPLIALIVRAMTTMATIAMKVESMGKSKKTFITAKGKISRVSMIPELKGHVKNSGSALIP